MVQQRRHWREHLWLVPLAGALAVGVLATGLALAQDPEPDDGQTDGELPVQRRAQLTPQEQMNQARRIAQQGEDASRRLQAMLDEARRERDFIRITCLDSKLTQVNAHRRTLDSRFRNLEDASNLGDESRRNHEFTLITVLGQAFSSLEQEANTCIGQDIYNTGTTTIITEVDPATPVEDPSAIQEPGAAGPPFIPLPESGPM